MKVADWDGRGGEAALSLLVLFTHGTVDALSHYLFRNQTTITESTSEAGRYLPTYLPKYLPTYLPTYLPSRPILNAVLSISELLVSLPMSVFLPSLVMRRSVMTTPTSRSNDDFDDVGYGDNNVANLTSLDQIFSTFGLDELECQKRFICEALQEPKKFDPISSIIFLLLR